MPKKRRKKKKKSRANKPQGGISESANLVRFSIFLAIGLILLGVLFYFSILASRE